MKKVLRITGLDVCTFARLKVGVHCEVMSLRSFRNF